MKTRRILLIGLIFTALPVILAACSKKEVFRGGEDTNFPFSWEINKKGQIMLTLDGSYGDQDYSWTVACDNESVLSVEQSGKEKKGRSTYCLAPLAEGEAVVTFIREREVPEAVPEPAAEDSGDDEEDDPEHLPANPEDLKLPEELLAEQQDPDAVSNYEMYTQRFEVKDRLCEIYLRIIVTGEGSGLQTEVIPMAAQELSGVLSSESEDFTYRLWEDSSAGIILRVPSTGEAWTCTVTGNYVPEEYEEIPGIMPEEPETDEEGNVKMIDFLFAGVLDGEDCYEIRGLAEGTAELTVTSPDGARKIIIETEINSSREVNIISHRTEP